jgi:uncharacterized membrane protein YtjA (UPF0391 family)
MLNWSITLLVLAAIAALLIFSGLAGAVAGLAKILLAACLLLLAAVLLFKRGIKR